MLQEIGALGIGATASAEDASVVDQKIDTIHEWLIAKDIAYWGTAITDIPLEAEEAFISLVAARVQPSFRALDARERAELNGDANGAIALLRDLASDDIAGEPIKATYY